MSAERIVVGDQILTLALRRALLTMKSMASSRAQRHDETRETLATTTLVLLCVFAAAVVAATLFQHALHITADALRILERLFVAIVALAALIARWYFR
jgi:hypothetical protein